MVGYDFPDVPRALVEIIGPTATLWLHSYDSTINHIYAAGGNEVGPLRSDRVVINTYAPGRDAAKGESERVRQVLQAAPHETAAGLIDHVHVEVNPHSVAFQHDTTNLYQATYRVDVRPI